jgi:hypothetical protein
MLDSKSKLVSASVVVELMLSFQHLHVELAPGEVTKCTYGTPTCETILDPLYTFVNLNKMK